jgi:hypothetical protein
MTRMALPTPTLHTARLDCVPSTTRMRTTSSRCTATPTCCATGTHRHGANACAPSASSRLADRWHREAPGRGWQWIVSPTGLSCREVRGVVAKLLVGRCSEECDGEVDDFGVVQVAAADQGVPGWEGNEVGCSSLEATSSRSECRLVRQ